MAAPRVHLSASLHFSEGKSDKVYHEQVLAHDPPLWVRVFQFGRRGSAQQSGTKTAKPVPLETAPALFQGTDKADRVPRINRMGPHKDLDGAAA
jgi:hypothetical protein